MSASSRANPEPKVCAAIQRKQLLDVVREELMCTIGSADAPITIPVLITLFREDTRTDIKAYMQKLGYPSIQAMLGSEEFADIIEPCYTRLAKGAGNKNPEEVHCYKVKPRGDIAHILSCIEEGARYKNAQLEKEMKRKEAELNDPIMAENILLGKLKICELLAEMGAEEKAVDLLAFQNKYLDEYKVVFDKKERKNYFPTGELKPIMTEFLYNEVEIFVDLNKTGSMSFQLRKPWEEIEADCKRIFQEREELEKLKEEAEAERQRDEEQLKKAEEERKEKQKAAKRERTKQKVKERKLLKIGKSPPPPPQPKKVKPKQPPPPPKQKPVPVMAPMFRQANEILTTQPELIQRVAALHYHKQQQSSVEQQTEAEDYEDVWGEDENAAEESGDGAQQNEQIDEEMGELLLDNSNNAPNPKLPAKKEKAKYTKPAQEDEPLTESESDQSEEEEQSYKIVDWKHSTTSSSNPSPPAKAEKEKVPKESAEEKKKKTEEEYLKRLQQEPPPLSIQERGMLLGLKRQEKQEAWRILDEKFYNPDEKVEGVFNETYRTGKGAQIEAERRQRMEALLAEEADNLEGKPTLVVAKGKENSKYFLASLIAQMVWANHELGLSEVEDRLRLLFANHYGNVKIDVEQFVDEFVKPAELIRAPKEPHVHIMGGCARDLTYAITHRLGKAQQPKRRVQQQPVKPPVKQKRVPNLVKIGGSRPK